MSNPTFLNKINKAINNLPITDKEKVVASIFVRFCLSFESKDIKFSIKELASYGKVEECFLDQLYSNYTNPKELEQLAAFISTWDNYEQVDENKINSLCESTLLALLGNKLLWENSGTVDGKFRIHLFGYSILSSLIPYQVKDEFFSKSFKVTLSEEFWEDYLNSI